MIETDLPLPPLDLANRVGELPATGAFERYRELGAGARAAIEAVVPPDLAWRGATVLDFGCGAGRTLRHFAELFETTRFVGCDIDADSIAWLRGVLPPSVTVFENGPEPPLPLDDGSVDLVYAISVFTHLTASWSAWLHELHRILSGGGIAVLTFMGQGMVETFAGHPVPDDELGMTVLRAWQGWDLGGPMVLHSDWWIREHWGRAFDVVSITPDGFCWVPGKGQGIAVLRRRDVDVTTALLERIDASEPRELVALQSSVRLLGEEAAWLASERDALAGIQAGAERRADELRAQVAVYEQSRSWRLTAPLRSLARRARERRAS